MSWKQWLVGEASRAIIPDGSCDLSLKIGPLPAARTALPLPRSLYLEISSADGTSPNLGFVEESLIPLHRCFATPLKMRHNPSSHPVPNSPSPLVRWPGAAPAGTP